MSYNGTSTTAIGALAAATYQSMFENSGVPNMYVTKVDGQPMDEYYLERVRIKLTFSSTYSHVLNLTQHNKDDMA